MSDITFEYVTEPGDSITFELTDMVTLPPGGGGGTSDHRDLTNRSSADQHPTSAITGLDTELAGKETAGAAATAQAYAVQRANHTGTQSADSLTDGTTNKAYTAAEQTKLAAITGTNTGDQTLPTLSSLGAVPTSRTLAGLDLSADRTASALRTALGLVIGTDVLAPNGSGASLTGIPESAVTNLVTDLAAKAPLASPALTGNPTAPTQTAGDNSTKVATTAYVDTATASLNLPFTTGDYYSLSGGETPNTPWALTSAGVLEAHPVYLQAGNYDRIAMYVATAAVSTYRLGVYPNNAATYKPDGQTLILDAGTLNMNAGTGIQQITVSLTIPTSGIYWLAVLCDSYTAKPSIVGWVGNPGAVPNVPYFGNIVYGNVAGRSPFGVTAASVATGAMPTTFPTTTRTDVLPQITVRKAT